MLIQLDCGSWINPDQVSCVYVNKESVSERVVVQLAGENSFNLYKTREKTPEQVRDYIVLQINEAQSNG